MQFHRRTTELFQSHIFQFEKNFPPICTAYPSKIKENWSNCSCRKKWVASEMALGTIFLQFLSFSCSFWQKICQIIGWRTLSPAPLAPPPILDPLVFLQSLSGYITEDCDSIFFHFLTKIIRHNSIY